MLHKNPHLQVLLLKTLNQLTKIKYNHYIKKYILYITSSINNNY